MIIRHIVSYTRDCHLASEMLKKYQKSFGKRQIFFNRCRNKSFLGCVERQLIFDVTTQWNSTFYMLQRFLQEKICITACLNEKLFITNLNNNKFSRTIEWDMMDQLMVEYYL